MVIKPLYWKVVKNTWPIKGFLQSKKSWFVSQNRNWDFVNETLSQPVAHFLRQIFLLFFVKIGVKMRQFGIISSFILEVIFGLILAFEILIFFDTRVSNPIATSVCQSYFLGWWSWVIFFNYKSVTAFKQLLTFYKKVGSLIDIDLFLLPNFTQKRRRQK